MTATHLVAHMTWADVEHRLQAGAAALLPIGAAAKEHGLHLPMDTDERQALWLAKRLATEFDLLIWPPLNYGHYPAFTDFPGSISLSAATFTALMTELIGGVTHWRPTALFVLDTGISTLKPVAEAVASKQWPVPVVHLRIHDGPCYRAAADKLRQQAFGSHADELETSRMLAMEPDMVNMGKAEATPSGPIAGPLTRTNAPSGSYGDPTLATAEKGEALWAAMFEDLRQTTSGTLNPPACG